MRNDVKISGEVCEGSNINYLTLLTMKGYVSTFNQVMRRIRFSVLVYFQSLFYFYRQFRFALLLIEPELASSQRYNCFHLNFPWDKVLAVTWA